MPLNASPLNEPLSEAELDRLAGFLNSMGEQAMNIEELDGFFAALLAGPDLVLPSEYLPLVFGDAPAETPPFDGIDEANDILGLILRHWNGIAATLHKGDVHLPILLEDENGVTQGVDWSHGFMRAADMRRTAWAELLRDEEYGGCMIPVLTLYHEHDDDPEMRPPPIGPELREEIILQMAAGVVRIYRYFQSRPATPFGHTARRQPEKTGRNEPCPCGSGKKYKRCCGGVTIH